MNIIYTALYKSIWLISLLPLSFSRILGKVLGQLILILDSRHRNIALNNIRASFPESSRLWINNITLKCFSHLGQIALEISQLVRLTPHQILAYTRHHGLDHLEAARAKGKGVLLLTGHLGNWEWAAVASGLVIGGAYLVARPLDWLLAERLLQRYRIKTGNVIIPKSRSARKLMRILKNNGIVAILLDQNVDWYNGEWVNFFGRLACTNKGLALLAMYTKAPVLTYHNFRSIDGYFDVYFGEELPLVQSGDKSRDIWENTQNYSKALEKLIRQKPDQWFWLHQRWKTKPFYFWPRGLN